jgi:hypothetical protein
MSSEVVSWNIAATRQPGVTLMNLPGRLDVRPSSFSVLRTQTTEPGGFIAHPVNGYDLDLQTVFDVVYDRAGYDYALDYGLDVSP